MTRLTEIAFCLPDAAPSRDFLHNLQRLLASVAYAASEPAHSLTLTPAAPESALPVTVFRLAEVTAPEVALDIDRTIGITGSGPRTDRDHVEFADLTQRLAGTVRSVDHTGVNLCASAGEWDRLVQDVAASSAMYRYPTGEPWHFMLPSTSQELENDIRGFVVGREPRFELVHEPASPNTTWQFALGTSLTRTELERMFPDPVGIAIPGLEQFFRSVYVKHTWPNLEIRFDLYFRIDDGPSDWETGEWLVTQGGRIR